MPGNPADDLGRLMRHAQADLMQRIDDELKKETFLGGKRVRVQPLPKLPRSAATTVHLVKVTLYGSKPPIWRRLEIPSAAPLDLVHEIVQIAFGWYDLHLHSFETVCGQFGPPDDDEPPLWGQAPRRDEATAALGQVAPAVRAKVVYIYDFGDDWRHDIVVEKIDPAEPGVAYPRCLAGRRAAPPEDSGGIWAYDEAPTADDSFDPDEVTGQLSDTAVVLIP